MLDYTQKSMKPRRDLFGYLHIILSIAVMAMAVLTFLDVTRYRVLFPAVFLTAGLLDLFEAAGTFRVSVRGKKRWGSILLDLLAAAVLFALAGVSLIAVYR